MRGKAAKMQLALAVIRRIARNFLFRSGFSIDGEQKGIEQI